MPSTPGPTLIQISVGVGENANRKVNVSGVPTAYEWGTQDLLAGGPLAMYRPFTEYSKSGAVGEPELASTEKGAEPYRRLGDEMERLLRQVYERNRGESDTPS